MRRSRVIALVLAASLAGLSGYAVLDAYDVVPGILTISAPSGEGAGTLAPGSSGTPEAAARAALPSAVRTAPAPLAPLSPGAARPARAGLSRTLSGTLRDPALGSAVSAVVRDTLTHAMLFAEHGDTPRAPASTTKLLTAAASLAELGPSATATTSAVQGSSRGTVLLVAGGDSLLATGNGDPDAVAGHAGLGDLAAQVAAALATTGTTSVRLGLDDHVDNGPRYAPKWLKPDINAGFTGPVAMLGLADRRAHDGHPVASDAAMATAEAFSRALRAQHLKVTGAIRRSRAGAHAVPLGAVTSAPVADVLSSALGRSDNALTETVARRAAAHAGAGTSFADVASWVRRSVSRLGIDTTGVHLVDSCGLSRGTAIPARVLTDVLDLAADGRAPGLQQVVARLPVAGLSGTLKGRFSRPSTRVAAGLARAKTGTLTGVSALAGTVVDRDGRMLTFAFMVDRVPAATGSPAARHVLDRLVAALAGCGCR